MTIISNKNINFRVTYLEMENRPTFNWPKLFKQKVSILKSEHIPPRYFLFLYKAVGSNYSWTDQLSKNNKEIDSFINNKNINFFTLIKDGWTAGFYMLNYRKKFICDISYIGLVPEATGYGLGTYLFKTAILTAWDNSDIKKLTVNTCSLDHKNALPLYQKLGFNPVRYEDLNKSY